MSLPETYKALIVQGQGQEPKLEQVILEKPGKNQVLVQVEFAPVNPSDIQTSEGFYKIPVKTSKRVGLEGSGTVVAVGQDLKVSYNVGDKVHIVSLGTYGQYLLANSENLRKVKEGLSLEEAACHWINPGAVVGMAHLVQSQGQKIAIHTAGSSALGKMMIRYFKLKGLKTINIVRRDDAIAELKEEGADYVLNSKDPDFEEKLREIAHKEGAKISFEAVCGDLTEKILNSQPEGSTCYIYGGLSGGEVTNLNIQHFIFEGKTLSGFWLTPYFEKNVKSEEERDKLFAEMYGLLPTIFKSEIQKVFKLDEIKEALAYYEKNSYKGKILIKPN